MQSSFKTAGHFIDGFYSNAYGTRAYKLYMPSGSIGQAPALLVMLHGCYQNPDIWDRGYGRCPRVRVWHAYCRAAASERVLTAVTVP